MAQIDEIRAIFDSKFPHKKRNPLHKIIFTQINDTKVLNLRWKTFSFNQNFMSKKVPTSLCVGHLW